MSPIIKIIEHQMIYAITLSRFLQRSTKPRYPREKSSCQRACKNIIWLCCLFQMQLGYAFLLDKNYVATWTGIEIIGTNQHIAQEIRKNMPLQIGSTFKASTAKEHCLACEKYVRQKLKIKSVICSIVWYGDRTAYLVVDLPKRHWEKKLFRTIPKEKSTIIKLPKELNELYLEWENKMSSLMSSGHFPTENFEKGFRDFDDPILHKLALHLVNLVTQYNSVVLDVIHYSHDAQERQKAADLLAWAKNPRNIHYVLKWDLLNDPDKAVRNNMARSFSFTMSEIKDEKLLTDLIPIYCRQAKFPSHTDRNKALFSIKEILEAHPKFSSTIDSECKNTIQNISNTSILKNIKDPANDILSIIALQKSRGIS